MVLTAPRGSTTIVCDDARVAHIALATSILATKLFKRSREAPFGIITLGGDQGGAMRLSRTDPDLSLLIDGYTRSRPIA